ncbi:MAG: zinc-dependent alcohol dehydrogenase family protein [Nitrospina sp.]|jgi:NADPH2:quinone reductase|nr:zinc-dependent alcohol dehydrogenase family protein [Nitrospina sp.]
MKAYKVHEYGDAAKFIESEVNKPGATSGHIVIEVKATSLNPVDHKILKLDLEINPALPATLHMDVAGVIVEVGDGVTDFKIGDEVYGCAGGLQGRAGNIEGALADFMLADSSLIALKPKSLSFSEAAALPLVSITAWEGLFDRAHINTDDHVLIHAAAGGVGHIAIQLAKQHGARIATTVSSEDKAKIAKDLGVDDIINYRDEAVEDYRQRLTHGKGFDVVFDTIGGGNLDKSLKAARVSGQVISIVGNNQHDLSPMHMKGLSLHLVFMLLPMLTGEGRAHHGFILKKVAELVDKGIVKPLVNKERFKFSQADEAHALFAANKHLGKIVLENN